jgi:hypothetical protein
MGSHGRPRLVVSAGALSHRLCSRDAGRTLPQAGLVVRCGAPMGQGRMPHRCHCTGRKPWCHALISSVAGSAPPPFGLGPIDLGRFSQENCSVLWFAAMNGEVPWKDPYGMKLISFVTITGAFGHACVRSDSLSRVRGARFSVGSRRQAGQCWASPWLTGEQARTNEGSR